MLFLMRFLLPPVSQSGDASVFAAASPEVRKRAEEFKGAYLMPVGKITKPSADAQNPQLARDLWETSEKQLAALGL